MTKLQQALNDYGADVDDIMRRFVDDEVLYVECLSDTLNDDAFCGLEEAISSKDVTTAFKKTHSLKGTALNMGLTPFYNAVVLVVEDLRAGGSDQLENLLQHLIEEKARVETLYQSFQYLLD